MKTTTSEQNHTRLGGYLTATVTLGTLASTANAGIVTLDISPISGLNGGVALGGIQAFDLSSLSPGLSGTLEIYNNNNDISYGNIGLDGDAGMQIATLDGITYAAPTKFSMGDIVDSSSIFSASVYYSLFETSYMGSWVSPDFGPGSFVGFKDGGGRYGYLEVTWTAATQTFEILSGAYESQAGVGIAAGAAIPEPSNAATTLGALAAGIFIRRRKQAA